MSMISNMPPRKTKTTSRRFDPWPNAPASRPANARPVAPADAQAISMAFAYLKAKQGG